MKYNNKLRTTSLGLMGRHKIIGEYQDLLYNLDSEKVLNILYENTEFSIKEACDGYYNIQLTSEMCNELSEMFKSIAKEIDIINLETKEETDTRVEREARQFDDKMLAIGCPDRAIGDIDDYK
jgi:hypothetical protein